MLGYMLVIPVMGLMELYTPDVVLTPSVMLDRPVAVNLTIDDEKVGTLFTTGNPDLPRNYRAERAAYLLCGAHFRIAGACLIGELTEHRALSLMTEVAA